MSVLKAQPHPDDLPHIKAALDAVEAGDVQEITQAELEHWADTCEWPLHECRAHNIIDIIKSYNISIDKTDIKSYSFGTELEQLAAVREDGYNIRFIHNPSEAVQIEAVKRDGYAIVFISNPSEYVQLEAVKSGIETLSIKITSEKAIEYFCKKIIMKKALQ